MAQQPADKDHPYGHARYEYLAGLVVSFLILLIGIELGRSSFEKILHPQAVTVTGITYLILGLSIGLKLWMSLFFRNLGKRIGSTALAATAADSRNDVIATTAVLLGCLSQQFLNLQIDGFVGLAVAGFILYSGVGIARETISPLLGQQADEEMLGHIHQLILRHDKVLGIHDLLVHDYGPGQCFASVHVEISAAEDPMDSHDIIDDIERDALEELNIHLVIHYDPVVLDDDEQVQLQQTVTGILSDISPELSIHDFRLLRHGHHKKLYFDLEVPYSMKLNRKDLQQRIDSQLPDDCTAVISFDQKE
jgi:cation diffusion facilitator family transporter